MFKILPSMDPSTIALEVHGKVTGEDAEMLDRHVKEVFSDEQHFNILAIFYDLDGTTFKGITDGIKFDAKRWNQFDKFAILSEKKWLELSTKIGNVLPGVTARHFGKNELDEAWNWIIENEN